MATAAVISFEDTRQAFAKPRARQQLHAYLDRWLDRLEAHMPDDTPSLAELTQAVFAMRQELTGKITEALVEQRHGRLLHQRTMSCPHVSASPAGATCASAHGAHHGRRGLPGPPLLLLPRTVSRASAPLDDALQLSERRTPWDMQQAGARLAAEVPFADGPGAVHGADRPVVERSYRPCGGGGAEPRAGGAGGESHGGRDGPPRGGDGGGQDVATESWCWRSMGRLSRRGRSRPRGRWLAAGTRGPSGPGGKGHGRRPRAFASTWWIGSGSCIC